MSVTNTKDSILINLAAPRAIASILENMNPVNNQIILTEDDSNAMIDKLAAAVKFKKIDGDQDNSFDEGSANDEIKLDDLGNYVGKGKTTIYNRDLNLEDETKSKQRWVETPTGKVSDGATEQVPNPQGYDNLNENEAMDFSDDNPNATIGETKSDDLDPNHKGPSIEEHRNMKSPLNHPQPIEQAKKVNSAIKSLFTNVKK